ncbi:uncharacterized protein LOC119573425 [Penaeus monodon]|uniref:uncharacterized protein LOC119573425 n=1 Tax=Penaeus monodon TaxID=6687 RepID=UPI0018A7B8B3|nr:uncharacterized protein LOC119573425 [Penaeus monodon]
MVTKDPPATPLWPTRPHTSASVSAVLLLSVITVPLTVNAFHTTINLPTTHSPLTIHNHHTIRLPLTQPSYEHEHELAVPECATNTTKPSTESELNTELSVDRPNNMDEETYLCPSETAHIRPLRAQNTEGKWRVVVNNIDVHYKTLIQTTRIEECLISADVCLLMPV